MISNMPTECELKQKSTSGDAVLTTGYADDYIIKGYGFNIQRRLSSLAAASTTKIIFDTSAVPSTSLIFTLPLALSATGGPVLIRTYKISTYTGGSSFDANKLNYLTTNTVTPATIIKYGITSTDSPGTDLREYVLGATGNEQQVNRSGAITSSSAIMYNAGVKICIEVTNNYGSAIDFVVGMVWYEIPAIASITPTNTYNLDYVTWTPITSAGQSACVSLSVGNIVEIDHSSSGGGDCSSSRAKLLDKSDTYQEMMYLKPSSLSDIFYARSKQNQTVTIVVDVK